MKRSRAQPVLGVLAACLLGSFVVFAAAPEFREYPGAEYGLGEIRVYGPDGTLESISLQSSRSDSSEV